MKEVPAQQKHQKIKTPFYYVKKRLLANIPAVFGMSIIILAVIISILGYSLMPDQTPYANDGAQEIKQQPPGFKVQILKIRKNLEIKKVPLFARVLFGQQNAYKIKPISGYSIDEETMTLKAEIFDAAGITSTYDLADIVKPLFIGKSEKINSNQRSSFIIRGEQVTYLDLDEKVHVISKQELINQFKKECLETRSYILGTDIAGRDMLSRLLFGVRISLGIGLISVFISFVVGLLLGSLAGFFGGWIDALILWFMTVVWSIPGIMLVIAISLALGKGVLVAFIAIGLTTWVEIARVVRGQILSIKQKLFIEAARAIGMRSWRIITVHILPNIIGPLIVIMTSNFASAILTEAGLSFLGLSAQIPMPSWGVMVNEGFDRITANNGMYLVLFPSLCIALMVLAFNLFGNGLRDAYDPKTTRK